MISYLSPLPVGRCPTLNAARPLSLPFSRRALPYAECHKAVGLAFSTFTFLLYTLYLSLFTFPFPLSAFDLSTLPQPCIHSPSSMMAVSTAVMVSPAARTCWGMKLVAVMPGVVFTSSRLMTSPSVTM